MGKQNREIIFRLPLKTVGNASNDLKGFESMRPSLAEGVSDSLDDPAGAAAWLADHQPVAPLAPDASGRRWPEGRIVPANAGDHALIHQLLVAAGQSPSREEFHASLDDPNYEPTDRLLVKLGARIIAHVQLTNRTLRFGACDLPLAGLQWLAILPEYRRAGFMRLLLEAADRQMRQDGAAVATLRTHQPEQFEPLGWLVSSRPRYTQAGARDILAYLSAHPLPRRRQLSTRMWRHVELPALLRIYGQSIRSAYGPLVRSEDYWRWLISRQGYDQIIVAIEGDDRLEFGDQAPAIVGYGVTRQEHIVELAAEAGHPTAAAHVLARACVEAIERDHPTLRFHAAPDNPLHQLLSDAGGSTGEGFGAAREVSMMKILDLPELVARLFPELHARAKAARVTRPLDLRISAGSQAFRLMLSRRRSRLVPERPGRCDVVTDGPTLGRMLLGLTDPQSAATTGALRTRTKSLVKLLGHLLPKRPLWRPLLDDLPA